MKILYFIESLRSGGKERRLVELLRSLHSNPDIQIQLVLSRNEIYYKEVLEMNIPIFSMDKVIKNKDLRPFIKFFKVTKSFNPDLIHVWGTMVAIYAIPTKILLNIRMINSEIVDAPVKVPFKLLSHRISFLFSDIISSNSKAGLKSYNAPTHKSKVISNGFSFDRINNIQNKNFIRDQFRINTKYVIGMAASFSELKDYKTYIESAILVLKDNDDITFLCIGSGDDSKYKELVPKVLKSKIQFLGSQRDILSIMNVCDIGVLSTYTEGISNSIIEFMALSKPVVATDGGGTKELIVDGETGFLIKKRSEIELAEKIKYLLNNNSMRILLGKNGVTRIHKKFDIRTMTNAFLDVYNEFSNNKKKRRNIKSLV